MSIFYFTYGTDERYPFSGGWTEVIASDYTSACHLFRAAHPDRTPEVLNCADVYTRNAFLKTEMSKDGNLGHRCHEVITLHRERIVGDKRW